MAESMTPVEPIDVRTALRSFVTSHEHSSPHAVVALKRCIPALDELFSALTAYRLEANDKNRIRLAIAHGRASGVNVG